jgi:hypothetical protein
MPEGVEAVDRLLIVTCLARGFGVAELIVAMHGREPSEGDEAAQR